MILGILNFSRWLSI